MPGLRKTQPGEQTYVWASHSYGSLPQNAVVAGSDIDGSPLYAGRASHEGYMLPAKVAPAHHGAFVPNAGLEHSKFHYEVLCSSRTEWQPACNGEVPPNAIVISETSDGEELYMGRVAHEGSITPGKIQPSHGVLYIPFGGKEHSYKEYEVLVLTYR